MVKLGFSQESQYDPHKSITVKESNELVDIGK